MQESSVISTDGVSSTISTWFARFLNHRRWPTNLRSVVKWVYGAQTHSSKLEEFLGRENEWFPPINQIHMFGWKKCDLPMLTNHFIWLTHAKPNLSAPPCFGIWRFSPSNTWGSRYDCLIHDRSLPIRGSSTCIALCNRKINSSLVFFGKTRFGWPRKLVKC